MSDIFEIKGVDAELRVAGKSYKFADPRLQEKVLLEKELNALNATKESMDTVDWVLKSHEIFKKMIRQYLPEMEQSVLDQMGDNAMTALLEMVTDFSQKKFGAVVQKVEQK